MKQKIIKVGNSAAVTIPQDFLRKSQWKVGDVVDVDANMGIMMVRDKQVSYSTRLTPEFKAWLDEISVKYKDAIKALAQV